VKNITISVDEDLWSRIREAAAVEHKSMNAFIGETMGKTLRGTGSSVGQRIVALADQVENPGASWKWNREELYEDAG
jgi:hypothetical protein